MPQSEHRIAAGEFKSKCLAIMDDVNKKHYSVIITKHGKPVAKLTPITDKPVDLFGCLRNTITIHGDIISPIDEKWEADED